METRIDNSISVIVPAYNTGPWIEQDLVSVLGQDHVAEVIVVNDGSTDDTALVVERLQRSERRLQLVSNDVSKGPSGARNTGIDLATGDWLSFVDADDILLPGRYPYLLALAGKTGATAVADNVWYFDETPENRVRTLFSADEIAANAGELNVGWYLDRSGPARSDGLGLVKALIRRDFVITKGLRYRESVHNGEDFLFYLEVMLQGGSFHLSADAYYLYRVHAGSTIETQRNLSALTAQAQVLEHLAKECFLGDSKKWHDLISSRVRTIEDIQVPLLAARNDFINGHYLSAIARLFRAPRLWRHALSRAWILARRRLKGELWR